MDWDTLTVLFISVKNSKCMVFWLLFTGYVIHAGHIEAVISR